MTPDTAAKGGWEGTGRNPHPTALRGTTPIGFNEGRVSLAVFQAALCQSSTWELYQNNIQASCHDPGDWNASLGKPPQCCRRTRHGLAVPAAGRAAEPAALPCLWSNTATAPEEAAHTNCNPARRVRPLFSYLPLAENALALDVDHTHQGLDLAVPALGRQHRLVARTTTPCSAKGGALLTPQTSHKSSPAGYDWFPGRGSSAHGPRRQRSLCNHPCLGYLLDHPLPRALTAPKVDG